MTQPAYQTDRAGLYAGETVADDSPLEPGVLIVPAGAVLVPPPQSIPDGQWPRWNGSAWDLVPIPPRRAGPSPAEKLAAFLAANPDVAALIEPPAV